MKRIVMLVMLVLGVMFSQAQELKGVTLGTSNEKVTEATLGGIDGKILSYSIADGRTYMIVFVPNDRIWSDDVENLKDGLGTKYGLELGAVPVSKDYTQIKRKDGIEYIISAEHNRYMSPRYKFRFYMVNSELDAIHKAEEKATASSDF